MASNYPFDDLWFSQGQGGESVPQREKIPRQHQNAAKTSPNGIAHTTGKSIRQSTGRVGDGSRPKTFPKQLHNKPYQSKKVGGRAYFPHVNVGIGHVTADLTSSNSQRGVLWNQPSDLIQAQKNKNTKNFDGPMYEDEAEPHRKYQQSDAHGKGTCGVQTLSTSRGLAQPLTNLHQQQVFHDSNKQKQNIPSRKGSDGEKRTERTENSKRPRNILLFSTVMNMIEEDTQPCTVVRKFNDENAGLKQFLEKNSSNWEAIELIMAVLGNFCVKSGVAQFHNGFIKIVQLLAEKLIFSNLDSVILNIPKSRARNLGTTEERLRRLVESINYVTTEMLTVMPALACDFLGEQFFVDICALKNMPSIFKICQTSTCNAFTTLEEGTDRLKNAWEQHSKAKNCEKNENQRQRNKLQRQQLLSMLKPPNDFRQLSVMPEWDDVCSNEEPFLRPNIIQGSYSDVETYLDIQFRLLREDFFSPLREGLLAFRSQMESKQKNIRVDNVRLYYEVKIRFDEKQSDNYLLEFSTKNLQRVNWEGSKRLLFGSLLLLSVDNFNSFLLFTVVDRKPDQLAQGRIKAKFEGESLPEYAMEKNLIMAESSVFFEAYRSVLIALQRISPAHFPMEDYILCRNVSSVEPDYLKDIPDPIYDLTSVRKSLSDENQEEPNNDGGLPGIVHRILSQVHLFSAETLPDAETLGLDPSQANALYAALTRKLVVIQGPPGTGKTYLGLKIVQALLYNRKYWFGLEKRQPSPILVICYTNHALDQFLEGIMKFTQKIVRIGGQSKCEALEPFSLREWKQKATTLRTRPGQYRHWLYEARNKLMETKRIMENRRMLHRMVESFGIVHEESLFNMQVLKQSEYRKIQALKTTKGSVFSRWLGIDANNVLREIIWALKKNFLKSQNSQPKAEIEPVSNEQVFEEEEWEKEDVEEIEGQRMVDDDDVNSFVGIKREKEWKPEIGTETGDIQFAISTVALDENIKYLEEVKLNNVDEIDEIAITQFNMDIEELQQKKELLKELLANLPLVDAKEFKELFERDLTQLTNVERWKIYSFWRAEILKQLIKNVNLLNAQVHQQMNEMKDVETIETAEIIREAHIVGITTTGAAKQRALLEHLKCKIVIVEEAAEVLEAHIVTSLSSSCQQLILIGDHKQLRPPTTVFKLAKDFHLDVSLFERLTNNGITPLLLGVQHRMRPDVARLIVPSIYPRLDNHVSVTRYPDIPGMTENVFFLDHTEREKGDKSDQESRSHLNPYEAEMALALARHLLMQGFNSSQITILTTYSGQLLHLRKLRKNHGILQGVRISVVDNFQGEENDVIILSLVRSNDEAKVGFLKTENRICVALSRAKRGFYILGNMGNLESSSKLWREISKVLISNVQIGTHFGLRCEVHHTVINAKTLNHFPPEGGCFVKCLTKMPCGHVCPKICHAEDREHIKQKCYEKCLRACTVGHSCPKKCYQECNPCLTRVPKVLPCNHTQITECYKDPKEEYCLTKIMKVFPICRHSIELDCSKNIAEVKCPDLCGMHLDCDHICQKICHKRSSHAKMECTQPCLRISCPERHPCPKQCYEECGKCLVDMVKKLPCGHEGEIKCWILPKDAFCKVKMERILSNCQHTAMFDCSQSTDGYKCTRICGKLLCNEGHVCRKPCWEPCGPCNNRVERKLSCGHVTQTACYKDPLTIKCKFPKEVILPGCRHKVEIACRENPEEAHCPKPCDIRLDCGHQCTELCHVKKDPNHEQYLCKKACGRKKLNCKQDHKCGKKCHEDCDNCTIKVERKLPCNHSLVAECHLNDEDIKCKEIINKIIMECRHEVRVACGMVASRPLCKQPCVTILSCGHQCKKLCCEICSPADCQELIRTVMKSPCGHTMMRKCSDYRRSREVTEMQMVQFLQECPQNCNSGLPCEHRCKGNCGDCFNGRLHKACEEKCGRTLVCGHNCGVNCASSCPPCKETCEYRCQHSRCAKKCCEPCVNCAEPCGWQCKHYKCSLKCHELCNRPRCDKPCLKRLPCGHSCIGLCGEVCPPLCRICNKEQLTEFILYGNEEEEDARFVYLEDCKHSIEVEGLDHWMEMKDAETKEIQMKCCPRCKTIIRSCFRYGDVIKRNFQDILEVKKMLLRSRTSAKEFSESLTKKIDASSALNSQLKGQLRNNITDIISFGLQGIQDNLKPTVNWKKQQQYKSFDVDTRFMFEVQVDIIDRILELLKNSPKSVSSSTNLHTQNVSMNPDLLKDILNRAERLVLTLLNRERFTQQEHELFVVEVGRLDLIRAFFLMKSASSNYNRSSLVTQENKQLEEMLMQNAKSLTTQETVTIKEILQKMGQKLKAGLGISDEERKQILKAVGLTQGHWFKCPNGHIYAIGECGGAMEEASCNECGARIGGGSHALLSDNRVASEMDGARFGAWSEHANNMGNFHIDD